MPNQMAGFKELSRKLAALSAMEQGRVIRSAATAGGTVVVRKARANVPVGTVPHKTYKGRWVSAGFLKRSLKKSSRMARDKQSVTVKIGVKSEAFYGTQFLELGTSRHPARPWLRPALQTSQAEIVAAMREKILAHIKKIAAQR